MAQRSKPSLENPRLDGHPWTHRNKGCPDHAPIAPHRRAAGRRPAAGPAARSRQRRRGGGTGACRPAHGPVATNRGDRQRDPPGRCGNRGADQRPARRGAAPTGRDQHRGTDRPAFRQPGRIQLQSLGRQRHRRRLVRRPARNRREQDPGAAQRPAPGEQCHRRLRGGSQHHSLRRHRPGRGAARRRLRAVRHRCHRRGDQLHHPQEPERRPLRQRLRLPTHDGGGNQRNVSASWGFGELEEDRFNVFAVANYDKQERLGARTVATPTTTSRDAASTTVPEPPSPATGARAPTPAIRWPPAVARAPT